MLKAYVDLMSQPSRALYIFLKHTKIPHEIVPVALRKGEHLQEDYMKVNPFKQVPAIIDEDGFKLNESIAILNYLCDKHGKSDLYPTDLQQRARVNAFTHWQHLNLRLGGSSIFMGKVKNNETEVERGVKILKASIKKMETVFLKDSKFIYSDSMTIADLIGVCELMQPHLGAGVDVYSGFPKVSEWAKNVRAYVGESLFDEAHQHVARIQKIIQGPVPKL